MLLLLLVLAAEPVAPSSPSIAVLDVQAASPADATIARVFSDALVHAVATTAKDARVLGTAELKTAIGFAAHQQLLGCEDERCAADFSKAVAVDRLVTGRLGRVGDGTIVFLALIDTKSHAVLARTSRMFARNADPRGPAAALADALQGQAREAALALFLPEAAGRGDRPLAELRMAVLLDEVDDRGAVRRTRPVETCVQKQLLEAGASLVSPAVVKTLRGHAAPRAILDGAIPEDLGTDEVDVLFAGIVTYAPFADATAAKFPGMSFARAEMGAQLVRIDTGAVLASEQPSGLGRGYNVDAAQKLAAEKLCSDVRPLLEKALERRVSMGERVVLEVIGVSAADAASITAPLEKLRRVSKVRLRKVDKDKAIFEVTLAAGDAIALALDATALPIVVDSMSAGVLRARKAP